ncbi:MAG: hypothetical protein IJR13_10530 [Bacteroidales bacterium]|nr:hypothetical protein [Bacteroidales bacterium]
MHTQIDQQVSTRFFQAIDTLIESKSINSIDDYCNKYGFSVSDIMQYKDNSSNDTIHYDYFMPLVMEHGVSSLWLLTGLGNAILPAFDTSLNSVLN